VDLDYTEGERDLRAELRAYFSRQLSGEFADLLREDHGPRYREWMLQLGADGWLGLGWPVEYGGQERSTVEQFIFYDEAQRAGCPVPTIPLNTVAPTLMRYGTQKQKNDFLPRILRGEIDFAIGYTEPDAGTDLAALRTRAIRDGDQYIVNGSKVFTSRGATADYIWLAARTEPNSHDHRGISVLILDTETPGFKTAPIRTIAGYSTYASFYDDVAVPTSNLVGEEHRGWWIIMAQLNHERMAMASFGGLAQGLHDKAVAWAGPTVRHAQRVIDIPWVQANLARSEAILEAMQLLNTRLAWQVGRGEVSPADASAAKVYGTEAAIEVYRLLMEVVGEESIIQGDPHSEWEWGALEFGYRRAVINTFGGGTNEVQRDIVAQIGLGMPRSDRRIRAVSP